MATSAEVVAAARELSKGSGICYTEKVEGGMVLHYPRGHVEILQGKWAVYFADGRVVTTDEK